eukprot:CAMPEP_0117448950 /NCGR_PEP_ID=MMETSP0759-20121206/7676_1 /TAXON_ID=63605 /ORGANISM="Percolomonas cosmopolitus, Strain WS" /LENGTH=184 /DNA_ID=CAMNT_0005241375 /DNA_START=797 /DNA_END=1351 /DNA_ORIENTATION=-
MPRVEFEFFKRIVMDVGHNAGGGDSLNTASNQPPNVDKEGSANSTTAAVVASAPTPLTHGIPQHHMEYDYTIVEFTNKRRSKLIPILQQQQSDVLPFYLPSFPRAANIGTKENSKGEMKEKATSKKKTETSTQQDQEPAEDLNVLEIQQKVIESYRRRGKKRKRKVTQNRTSKINPYLEYVAES